MSKAGSAAKVKLSSYDDLFGNAEEKTGSEEQIIRAKLTDLHEFRNHPFRVLDDEKMEETTESISKYGVLVPGIARPRAEGGYEIIAGHRRKRGSERAGKRICEAYCQELLQIAPMVTQKALEEHLKMQKRQQKRDRERLEEARRPFEELNEQYVGFNETTGGIELMIGGKKQEKAAKVITIPTDRTYQQGFRAEKREEPEADSEYMSRQAENALKKLRAIGG